jgi:hypothetical protein
MNLDDLLLKPQKSAHQTWQMGAKIQSKISTHSVVLIFCEEYRGAKLSHDFWDTESVRQAFYALGEHQNPCQVVDLGNMILGKTLGDSQVILTQIITHCLSLNALPIIIGGSQDLNLAVVEAFNRLDQGLDFVNFSPDFALNDVDEHEEAQHLNHQNYLQYLLSRPELGVKKYSHLAYQEHLNPLWPREILVEANCEILKLSDIMRDTTQAEPYFRHANFVALSANALESPGHALSINPNINGLNAREICAYAKAIGMAPYLQVFAFWDLNLARINELNAQLIAQILWYFIDGVGIKQSHPKTENTEKFVILTDEQEYVFQRDVFKNQWYFGSGDTLAQCLPCSQQDYLEAKNGFLPERLAKQLK